MFVGLCRIAFITDVLNRSFALPVTSLALVISTARTLEVSPPVTTAPRYIGREILFACSLMTFVAQMRLGLRGSPVSADH